MIDLWPAQGPGRLAWPKCFTIRRGWTLVGTTLLILGLWLGFAGWWGCYTESGQARFDEMDELIPWFAIWASPVTASIGGIVIMIGRISSDSERSAESSVTSPPNSGNPG